MIYNFSTWEGLTVCELVYLITSGSKVSEFDNTFDSSTF